MATPAQIIANRLNAQKSTGPRTDEGKATASQNAVKHGLLARQAVIRGEDPGEFEFYRDQMLGELSASGAMESMLAERIVGLAWRLRRAERIQAEVFEAMLAQDAPDPTKNLVRKLRSEAAAGETALGRVVITDFANYRVFDRLGLYERRLECSLYRTMAELRRLRLVREVDEPTRAARGIVKAGGLGDGGTASEGNHRQSFDGLRRGTALDAATQPAESIPQPASRTPERPIRQTNRISPFAAQKPAFERRNEGHQSVRQPKPAQSGRYEPCPGIRSCGILETERQERRTTQT